MKKIVSIIIVNYNVAEYVQKLVESVYKYLPENSFEIIIIDNNSSDRTIENIKQEYPEVKLILSPENLGFSGGNNTAAKVAESEYLLFINPDCLLEEDCITPLIEELIKNTNIGLITPILKYGDGSYQSSYGIDRGVFVETIDAIYITRYPYLFFKKLSMMFRNKLGKPFNVRWISGAFMIIRKEIFNVTGGFDVAYPLNYEDMDLCKKVLIHGFEIIVHPAYYCIHYESKSQKKNFYNFVFKRYAAKLIYLDKYSKPIPSYIIRMVHVLGLYMRITFLFTKRDKNERSERKRSFEDSLKLYLNK
jgi:GT2 family glycosyltransferase